MVQSQVAKIQPSPQLNLNEALLLKNKAVYHC